MHILITADTVGGVWTYCRELVTGLLQRGVRVTLVSFGKVPVPGQTEWIGQIRKQNDSQFAFFPTNFKLEWMQDSAADLEASGEFLAGVISRVKPDLLHLNQYCYGALECDLPRIVVAHSDVVSWWASVHGEEPPPGPWMDEYRKNVARGLNHAAWVIAPSRWMLEQISRYYQRPQHASVIHNGRSPGLFNANVNKDNVILTAGRLWDAGKNAALLLRQPMPAPVRIVGAENLPDAQSAAFSMFSEGPGVRLESFQEETKMAEIFSTSGIYAAVSQYEPFGLAPVEAALSGCALVVSDISSFRELWQGAALFFRNNDAKDLYRVLKKLVRNPKLRKEYALLAFTRAANHFNAGRMIDEYLKLYKKLLLATAAA